MAENEVIRESDLIQLDGTIDKLITQLSELNTAYGATIEAVKTGAESIVRSLKTASGATKEGRKTIDEASMAANRYERALYELEFAMSETGQQVAWLKAQTLDVNKATVAQQRQLAAAATSYDRLKAEIKELTGFYKSLTEAERNDVSFGQEVIAELQAKNAELKKLEQAIKPVVEQMTRLQKAEQELAYLQSEEGQKLLEVKKQIRELTSARKEEKAAVDPLAAAQEKYSRALNEEAQQIRELNFRTKQINTERNLEAKVAATTAGSYNRLSAEYELLKFKVKNMSSATEEGRQEIEEMQGALRQMFAEMRSFQEATGVYSLGVGDYAQTWSGLGYSVQQVIRELPSATVSLNTFFLAISNNIPMLVDELQRAKLAFDAQAATITKSAKSSEEATELIGKLDKPLKTVIKTIFSWQTAFILALTILPKYGDQIIDWVGKLFEGENAVKRLSRALKAIRKEMKDTNGDFGKNMLTIRKLSDEYKNLASETEKVQWIEDNKDAWRELNVAIYDVADAEQFFINRTNKVEEAFMQRARAAAAYKLSEEKFEELLLAEEERKKIIDAGPEAYADTPVTTGGAVVPGFDANRAQNLYDAAVRGQELVIEGIKEEIKLLYDLGAAAEYAAEAEVGEYDDKSKYTGGRDVTRYIESMKVKTTKEAEEAITRLQISEFAKRREEAKATYNEEVGQLQNTYNENKRILEGYYNLKKALDPQQKKELEASQAQILETLESYESVYKKTLSDIAKDEKIATAKRQQELIQIRLDAITKGSDKEYELREQAIEKQRELDKLENSKLIKNEQQDEGAIDAKYDKQLEDLEAERTINRLKAVQNRISLQLEAVKEGGKAEYELRKSDIKAQMEMEIAENSRLATEEQMTEEAIRAKYNKQLEDLEHEHQMTMFDIALEGIELRLGAVSRGSQQELDLMLGQIEQERLAALAANKQLAKDLQQSEDEINAYYGKRADYARGEFSLSSFRTSQTYQRISDVSTPSMKFGDEDSRKREVYNLEQDILDVQKQIELAEAGKLEMTEEQLANLKLQKVELENQKDQLSGFKGVIADIAEGGIAGGILGALGFDDDAIGAFQQAVNTVIDNISAIMEAEIEAAEAAVEASEERVNAAQSAYEAEIEARNNGYANSVESARKELEQERKNQAEKERLLEEAQKRQEQLNSIVQTSSLITAAAQLWSTMSSIPVVGPALALAAIGTMFGSFAAAKIKANQVASQQYGEGGLEFLEGGSHASGNDIDLGINNRKNRRMHVEGGEALAIINKRNTKRYRDILPSVIESFNNGTFHDKYANAFLAPGERGILLEQGNSIDLSTIEDAVQSIRRQNETKTTVLHDGTTIIVYKNVKRIVRKS